MVIGNGLIASVFDSFRDSEMVLIFASGVSDSTEIRATEFERELKLINNCLNDYPNMLFVYFSTYSIEDEKLKDRLYTKHKLAMEEQIINNSSNYLLCRLSNIVGTGGNRSNIFNYIVDSVENEKNIDVWKNASRSIISVDDMKSILLMALEAGEKNKVITIANEYSYSLPDLIKRIELHFDKIFTGKYLDKGSFSEVDINSTKKYFDLLNRDFSINYIDYLLKTYY
jgi:hypothetical protein